MMYYSERKKVNNGQAVAPVYHTGERDAMERQFHLNCANVLDSSSARNDLDVRVGNHRAGRSGTQGIPQAGRTGGVTA